MFKFQADLDIFCGCYRVAVDNSGFSLFRVLELNYPD